MGHVRQMNRATEVSARSLHGGELFMNEDTIIYHTAGSDTILVQIYMYPPQGSQGCQKIRISESEIKLLSFCANIALQRRKLQKTIKTLKKC